MNKVNSLIKILLLILTFINVSSYALIGANQLTAITPDGKFLYAGLNTGYTNWYKIDPDNGNLTFINNS